MKNKARVIYPDIPSAIRHQRSSEGKMSHFDQIYEINEQLLHL